MRLEMSLSSRGGGMGRKSFLRGLVVSTADIRTLCRVRVARRRVSGCQPFGGEFESRSRSQTTLTPARARSSGVWEGSADPFVLAWWLTRESFMRFETDRSRFERAGGAT